MKYVCFKRPIQLALLLSLSFSVLAGSSSTEVEESTKRAMTFAQNKDALLLSGGTYVTAMILEGHYDADDLWRKALPEYFQKDVAFKQEITKLEEEKRVIENRIKRYHNQFDENAPSVQRRLKKARKNLNKTIQELTGIQADSEAFRNEYRTAQHEFIKKNKILQKKVMRMGGSMNAPQLHLVDKVRYYVPKVIKVGALLNLGTYVVGSYVGEDLSIVPMIDTPKILKGLDEQRITVDCSDEGKSDCEISLAEHWNNSFRDEKEIIEINEKKISKDDGSSSSIQ